MKTIQVTQEEIKMATRPNVYRNRKKYTRKNTSWRKDCLSIIFFILTFSLSFSQTNTNYLIENMVTNNNQTIEVDDYEKQYNLYLEKSYKQKNTANWVGFLGGIVTGVGYTCYSNDPRIVQGMVLTTIITSSISTTFYITSSINRKKAYQLRRKNYL